MNLKYSFNFYRITSLLVLWLMLGSLVFANSNYRVPPQPKIKANSYLLIDFKSSKILVEKNINVPLEPASITKIMTVYAILKEMSYGNIDGKVTISKKAYRSLGSRTFLELNDKVALRQVLRGLIVQSGNDAAVALAEHLDGDEDTFVKRMNQYAKDLGMNSTKYSNSTGLPDADHYSTAEDIAILSQAMIREFPEYYKLFSEKSMTYNKIKQFNRNKLLWSDPTVDGIKTGHTKSAGYCLVSSAKRGEMRLIAIVLGAASDRERTIQSQKLINYGFRYFATKKMSDANTNVTDIRVWSGEKKQLTLGTVDDWFITTPKQIIDKVDVSYKMTDTNNFAPIEQGQTMGKMLASYDDNVIEEVSLIALESIKLGGLFERLLDKVSYFFNWLTSLF